MKTWKVKLFLPVLVLFNFACGKDSSFEALPQSNYALTDGGGNPTDPPIDDRDLSCVHARDLNADQRIDLRELYYAILDYKQYKKEFSNPANALEILLRRIQIFNMKSYSCLAGTEDGFQPLGWEPGECPFYMFDINRDRVVDLEEINFAVQLYNEGYVPNLSTLLRGIQIFNIGGYSCSDIPNEETEDGFTPGNI